ncbi:hypothetical protein H8959_009291 [Pygathrix nigripes]
MNNLHFKPYERQRTALLPLGSGSAEIEAGSCGTAIAGPALGPFPGRKRVAVSGSGQTGTGARAQQLRTADAPPVSAPGDFPWRGSEVWGRSLGLPWRQRPRVTTSTAARRSGLHVEEPRVPRSGHGLGKSGPRWQQSRMNCSEIIGQCQPHICFHGNCSNITSNNFICECDEQFSGSTTGIISWSLRIGSVLLTSSRSSPGRVPWCLSAAA